MNEVSLFWFRRDLRLEDNAGLHHALKNEARVQCIFIFDTTLLDKLEDEDDRRVSFIYTRLEYLKRRLEQLGSTLWVYHGKPYEIFSGLLSKHKITGLYTNRDYEPYARKRDKAIYELLDTHNIRFRAYKDHVIHEKNEVLKDDGDPYVVYTPYSRKWKEALTERSFQAFDTERYLNHLYQSSPQPMLALEDLGFTEHENDWPDGEVDLEVIKTYEKTRDIPAIQGTSRLSVHLRFGTVSIRQLMRVGQVNNEKWFNELIWREFYQMILWHFPEVVKQSFKPAYDHIEWRNNESEFEAWCNGKTGYPIVDAGMRELNQTGYMHNRVRMIVASFLTKHLLIDWRWGEAYFARKLLDYELASNNGGWQWAAGCGVDAAPYFRIFNPYLQTDKFDKDRNYIKKWVEEFDSDAYPDPIVDHKMARERCLARYKSALGAVK